VLQAEVDGGDSRLVGGEVADAVRASPLEERGRVQRPLEGLEEDVKQVQHQGIRSDDDVPALRFGEGAENQRALSVDLAGVIDALGRRRGLLQAVDVRNGNFPVLGGTFELREEAVADGFAVMAVRSEM
jgi:hypothetical protein